MIQSAETRSVLINPIYHACLICPSAQGRSIQHTVGAFDEAALWMSLIRHSTRVEWSKYVKHFHGRKSGPILFKSKDSSQIGVTGIVGRAVQHTVAGLYQSRLRIGSVCAGKLD